MDYRLSVYNKINIEKSEIDTIHPSTHPSAYDTMRYCVFNAQ